MRVIDGSHNNSQVFIEVAVLPVQSFDDLNDPQRLAKPSQVHLCTALVDTGAQITCITQSAAMKIGLVPVGTLLIQGVGGLAPHNYYIFKIGFNRIVENEVGLSPDVHLIDKVIEGAELVFGPNAPFDVLLGMDVISTGTLTISNSGRYRFSF